MTDPNTFTLNYTLAARELVKASNNPAHWRDIDNGDWDDWGAMNKARAQVIKQRKAEEQETVE